jgi:DNA-binding GntR family transcriptional regulator
VARSIARQIEMARYPVGSRLPTEFELAEAYAVSRSTVRSALDSLERLGMVSRRRRVGTTVESVRPTTGYARTVMTMNELVQYSEETRRKVLGRRELVADDDLAARLGVRPGRRLVHLTMVRLDGFGEERPLCHTDVYLDPDVAKAIGDRAERPEGLINEIVERCTGRMTDRVEQSLRACSLPGELAGILHADPGSPALEIVRRYVDGTGEASQVTVSVHPGDRFEFTMAMTRSGG